MVDALLFLKDTAAGIQDSAAVLASAPTLGVDSVVVGSPLPGGVAAAVRFLLDAVPWWLQLAGVVAGAGFAVFLAVVAVRKRRTIGRWLTGRPRGIQVALAASGFLVVLTALKFSTVSWDYTQHDNGFCTGCHVMDPAFQEFVNFEDKHDTLSCHDCHQQSVFASLRQLYLWVAERPEGIRPHATVANDVCLECHVVRGDTAAWQRIASTAGHRVHFESEQRSLEGLQCVTCHGAEVHRFVPAPATCGQGGCHRQEETTIVLGEMADQTASHCTACHRFTADVPLLATVDSARGTLVPARQQCLSCHAMQVVLADFDPALDPHGGTCGTCHNPHEQETPEAAITTCASSGCHDNWRAEPFHTGGDHETTATGCLTCHRPHQARVDASDCRGCHTAVRERTTLRPPLPFDTTRALLRGDSGVPGPPPGPPPNAAAAATVKSSPEKGPALDRFLRLGWEIGAGAAGPGWEIGAGFATTTAPPAPQDTFPHARHEKLACLECHASQAGHGGLTFVPPRGCAICHHQAPAASACTTCHEQTTLPAGDKPLLVSVPAETPRSRGVLFSHEVHGERRCVECHTAPVSLALAPAADQCQDCHEDHHTEQRECAACHNLADNRAQHDPETAHQRCDACHTRETVALLTPTRAFCSTCHEDQQADHYEPKECTVCHFLSDPATYRSRLLIAPSGR